MDNKIKKPISPSQLSSIKKPESPKSVNTVSAKPSVAPAKNMVESSPKPMTTYSSGLGTKSAITASEKIPQPIVGPKNYKRFFSIIGIVLLVLIVAVSLVLIVVYPRALRPIDISLDFTADIDIRIKDDLSVHQSDEQLPEKTLVMPGDTINYTFNIFTEKNAETDDSVNLDVFLRLRASIESEDNFFGDTISIAFTDNNEWFKGADGYYYYQKTNSSDGLLSPDEKISITRNLVIDKSVGNAFAGKTITIKLEADVLQAQYQAIEELWPTAPYEWASQYKGLTW